MNVDRALHALQRIAIDTIRHGSPHAAAAVRAVERLGALRLEAARVPETRQLMGAVLRAVGLAARPLRGHRRSTAALAGTRHVQPRKFTDDSLLSAARRAPHMSALEKILGADRKTIRVWFEKIHGRSDQSALLTVKPWLRRGNRRRSQANGLVQKSASE